MPFLRIETSAEINTLDGRDLAEKAAKLLAKELNKSERYVMVSIIKTDIIHFAGNDDPAAFLELHSIGLREDAVPDLSKVLCHFVQQELWVNSNRVYINFHDAPRKMWGWDSSTF